MDTSGSRFTTILRRPEGLYALFTRPKCAFRVSLDPRERKRNQGFEDLDNFYELAEVPLQEVNSSEIPFKKELLAARERLQKQNPDPASALADLLLISQLTLIPEGAESRPTSTQYEQICSRAHAARILQTFHLHQNEARRILLNRGCGALHIDCGVSPEPLPVSFQILLLPHLVDVTKMAAHQYLRIFWALSLQKHRGLLIAISRMASYRNHNNTSSWADVLERQLPNRRAVFATLLMESGVFSRETREIDFGIFDHLPSVTQRRSYVLRVLFLLRCIATGIEPVHIRMAVKLARPNAFLPELTRPLHVPEQPLQPALNYVHGCRGHVARTPLDLWLACCKLKGLAGLLAAIPLRAAKPHVALDYLRLFIDFALWQRRGARDIDAAWPILRAQAASIWDTLLQIDDSLKLKYLEDVTDVTGELHAGEFSKHFENSIGLLRKFYRVPLRIQGTLSWTVTRYARATYPMTRAFIHAPETSWRQLEKWYESNFLDAEEAGFSRMRKSLKYFSIKCFHHFPNKLFRVAKIIGSLPRGRARQILAAFRRHPLMCERFGRKTAGEIVAYFQARKDLVNPVPQNLQKFANVPGALTRARIRRYRAVFYINLHLTRLTLLEQFITEQLLHRAQAGGSISKDVEHGFRMLAGGKKNKRAGRRFLRAYLQGKSDYVLRHPRTETWVRAHSFLDIRLWMEGFVLKRDVEGAGPIVLHMEKDPLEAWKLGTYVQSCLSVYGINQQYAIAAVIDVNKRVVYARDTAGRVVARQLLAVSEEGKLVCFRVYPKNVSAAILKVFREYDVEFAKALGLRLHTNLREEYSIQTILSQAWYDDNAWNPKQRR